MALGRNQLIVWFASVLPRKMWWAGVRKQKGSDFFNKKNIHIASPLPNMFC